MVAPATYQRRSQATSGDRSWSSDALLPTLSSGTTTTSGARQFSKRPSGDTVTPLYTTIGTPPRDQHRGASRSSVGVRLNRTEERHVGKKHVNLCRYHCG